MKQHAVNVAALALALVVSCAVQFHLTAAPVPKAAAYKPEKLTHADLNGSWSFDWDQSEGDWIEFDNGNYRCQVSAGGALYLGQYAVSGNTVTLTEWRREPGADVDTGPLLFRLEFDLSQWPNMTGAATSGYGFDAEPPQVDKHTKIYNRKPREKK